MVNFTKYPLTNYGFSYLKMQKFFVADKIKLPRKLKKKICGNKMPV